MKVSFAQCKSIFDTLPIGYYLGRNVDAELSETSPASYCDLGSESIILSYPTIAKSLAPVIAIDDIELQVRAHLYHELSHVILTPKEMNRHALANCKRYDLSSDEICAVLNIIEDERIETIMKDYYLNTDFRKSLIMENPHPAILLKSQDPLQRFFAAVRFHQCKSTTALRNIKEIIFNATGFTRNSDKWSPCDRRKKTPLQQYVEQSLWVYSTYFKNKSQSSDAQNKAEEQKQNQESQPQAQGANSNSTASNAPQSPTPEQAAHLLQQLKEDDSQIASPTTAQRLVQDFVRQNLYNKDAAAIKSRVKRIVEGAMKKRAMQSASSNCYAGTINPRLVENHDYKWFTKKNNGSGGNRYSKIKINLFVDTSGSFCESIPKVNAILQAFRELENEIKDFSYDVISLEEQTEYVPKTTRSLKDRGCNFIGPETYGIYKQVQDPNARCVNIVVLDGYAWTSHRNGYPDRMQNEKFMGAFDHPNCIIVSDPRNEHAITEYAPQARSSILDNDYVTVFADKVFGTLERLLA